MCLSNRDDYVNAIIVIKKSSPIPSQRGDNESVPEHTISRLAQHKGYGYVWKRAVQDAVTPGDAAFATDWG